MRISAYLAAPALYLAFHANFALANRYSIIDLGFLVEPVGINRVGAIAANTVSRNPRGQIYRNGWHNLPPHSQVTAINRSGDAVGIDYKSNIPTFWPHKSDPVVLKLPDGAQIGTAYDVTNENMVVGTFDSGVGTSCFVWTAAEGAIDISSKEWQRCTAFGVNESGQVVGRASVTASSGNRAFIWENGKFTDLGVLPGKSISQAFAINAKGIVVGDSSNGDGSKAFTWAGALVDLDPSGRFDATTAVAINDSGEVVGWASENGKSKSIAVRFAHSKVLRLDSEILNAEGWKLQTATAINNKGVIVGAGELHGQAHGYMLVPQKVDQE